MQISRDRYLNKLIFTGSSPQRFSRSVQMDSEILYN